MKLYNGDCLEVMKELPDNSIDLCISSPPYNIGKSYNTYNDTRKDYIDWSIQVWNEVCRLLKDNGHLFVNIQYQKNTPFDIYKIFDNINWKLQNNIIWAKAVEIDGYVRG
jgi:DNA modification methylase